MGRPVFVVFRGNFVRDTLPPIVPRDAAVPMGPDARRPRIVTRFYLTKLDTVRAHTSDDCRGSRSGR
jgi:hypothetical protein